MPFLDSALGLTAMCSLRWGNLVAFDWNDLPVAREFDCKFSKKVKSPPYALPPLPPPRRHYIDRCIISKHFQAHLLSKCSQKIEWLIFSIQERLLYLIHVHKVFLYGLQGVLRFLARIDRFILSPIYVLIKMVCLHVFFQAEKRQQWRH